MSVSGIVENDTIKLPRHMHVPDGTPVEITFPRATEPNAGTGQPLAERYAKYVGIADALPEDFAQNHDHYLHGAPKRT